MVTVVLEVCTGGSAAWGTYQATGTSTPAAFILVVCLLQLYLGGAAVPAAGGYILKIAAASTAGLLQL